MELWIRSQDKKKLCVAKFFELDNDETGIFCFNGESYSIFAGKYKTKERALEVLDEIQKILNPMLIFKNIDVDEETLKDIRDLGACYITNDAKLEQISTYVYEMPEE
jgi:hypothetical protein